MRRIARSNVLPRLALVLPLAGLLVLLLARPVYANSSFSGYFLTVQMSPCPAEPYYIALLQEGDGPSDEEQRSFAPSAESLGPALWQALTRQLPEGWYMIEGVLLVVFRYSLRQNWKAFLLVNCCTQGLLWVFFGISATLSGAYSTLFLFLGITFLAEPVIMAIEAVLYSSRLRGGTGRRGVLYAITANLLSFLFGFWVVPSLWFWVSDTFCSLH